MKRLIPYASTLVIAALSASTSIAGEAATNATATNGWGTNGSAAAQAHYDGHGGIGLARTDTNTGPVNLARGLAVGFDRDGLDVSFSHAVAPKVGPAFAGTFNLSVGLEGSTNGSHGRVVSRGGLTRTAEAGGLTRSDPWGGTAQAHATGQAEPSGHVRATTHSFNHSRRPHRVTHGHSPGRSPVVSRFGRSRASRAYP